jgi:hypothetical protein
MGRVMDGSRVSVMDRARVRVMDRDTLQALLRLIA